MSKLLLFSHSGFSDENANGITMKNLLSAWPAEEKAEFYCDVQPPDFSAAHRCFRVTDTQMIKAFFGKPAQHIFTYEPGTENEPGKTAAVTHGAPKKIPAWLKKHKYNFWLKWLREYLWMISPWGHRPLKQWIRETDAEVIVYMVGESLFMDRLVLNACQQTGRPLVLYHGEAFRIIDVRMRRGLERAYYRKTAAQYEKLSAAASLAVYNCPMLRTEYEAMYPRSPKGIVAYNSAQCDHSPYAAGDTMNIVYFGNLGVGRSPMLLEVARILREIDADLRLDIYGNAPAEYADAFRACENIRYHGFVNARDLHRVIDEADILLHVESFDPQIIPKLRYAFSTKIAQCLCAGRCFVSFAPEETASSRYLASTEGAALVSSRDALIQTLEKLIKEPELREEYARKARETGLKNHRMEQTARIVREEIGAIT